ncbi:hypothetical protein SAMN02745945_01724 [Peptoclostridium litorale DSM 5388]|uniref:Nucleoside recognition domain-containing protein n=1 Tax=Peptoclostridium litorale DSM 5388 TaxID=1121324 RepID=A0A069RG37_PEPLI|nr:nucleoside recognition domain-containing protein [Peptoclostridium litorale]KDR96004.1 nucleoside recognition domain-containing protein [Peptoclostridium litorale DSM 5388]SIO06841.1 hypothetical protein SAMN02745945_01724 [Peptoclostridium litorale DSM 5388]
MINSVKAGAAKGIQTTAFLAKIVIPVYFVVTIIQHTAMIDIIAKLFSPIMSLFNLPGEAAIVLVLGNCLNIYAAIGAMSAIDLTVHQATTIALMLSFSHSLFMETAVVKMLGTSASKAVFTRLAMMVIAGVASGHIGGALL